MCIKIDVIYVIRAYYVIESSKHDSCKQVQTVEALSLSVCMCVSVQIAKAIESSCKTVFA